MTGKKDKQFLFEVKLNWVSKKKGLLFSDDAEGTLHVATPPEFGGEGRPWTPEHYFLSSISSCFMTTFLAFADKLHFQVSNFECLVTGRISIRDGRYSFASIELFPKIYIADESFREKADIALAKTHKYCIITNSILAPIIYNSEILVQHHPALDNLVN